MFAYVPALRNGFTQIPNILLDAPIFTDNEKAVIVALQSFAWDKPDCWPSRRRMATMTRLSERSLVNACAGLRAKKVIDYKRRGYGGSNRYVFLDPTIEAMIDRLLAEQVPAPMSAIEVAQVEPAPMPNVEDAQAEPELAPIDIEDLAVAPGEIPPVEPIIEEIPTEIEPVVDVEPSDPVEQIEPVTEQKTPVSPMGSIRANSALQSRANSARLMYKKTQPKQDPSKKNTQSRAQAPACVPKSIFDLAICIAFASTLRGITNPFGFGTTIWQDGREDGRIIQWQADQQADQQAQTIVPPINLTGGYDPDCPHCFGLGMRYASNWLANDLIACDCNQRD